MQDDFFELYSFENDLERVLVGKINEINRGKVNILI